MTTVLFFFAFISVFAAGYKISERRMRDLPPAIEPAKLAAAEWAQVFREVVEASDGKVSDEVGAALALLENRSDTAVVSVTKTRPDSEKVFTLGSEGLELLVETKKALRTIESQRTSISTLASVVLSIQKRIAANDVPVIYDGHGDVIGEQTRGLARVAPKDQDLYEFIGGLSSSSREIIGNLSRKRHPIIRHQPQPPTEWCPLALSVFGRRGETQTVQVCPQCLFKGEELFADDTSEYPGHGTKITAVFVGNQCIFHPTNGSDGIPTWMFREWVPYDEMLLLEEAEHAVGTTDETAASRDAAAKLRLIRAARKFPWRTCEAWMTITFQITFEETCKWEAVLWGIAAS